MAGQFPSPGGGVDDTDNISAGSYPSPSGGVLDADSATTTVALSGMQIGVGFGSMAPGLGDELAGAAVGVSFGSMTPTVTVPLAGWQVGVRFGRMSGPGEIYPMLWAAQPIWLQRTLPSYLYVQYNDDDDLQAFVESQNALQQELLDWIISIQLPVYTGGMIVGALLDWVALGLYGQARPTLPSGFNRNLGPYNTVELNRIPFNGYTTEESKNFYVTTDDVFKRIITWNFYKGDGRLFSVRWLKRRIMRFLLGMDGTDPGVDQTYQVSVGFSGTNQVDIRILSGLRTLDAGVLNSAALNTLPLNGYQTTFVQYVTLEFAPVFKAAVDSGALQMPFQFDWIVTV